jgi:hypothetical protein
MMMMRMRRRMKRSSDDEESSFAFAGRWRFGAHRFPVSSNKSRPPLSHFTALWTSVPVKRLQINGWNQAR